MESVTTSYILLLSLFSCINVNGDAWYGSRFICQGMNYCYDDQIHCDDNLPCTIDCDGQNACQYAIITCPRDAPCNINCHGGLDACKDLVVLAEESSSLNITCDENQDEACDEQVIYCPDNGYGGPKTTTITGLSLRNVRKKMEIFAVEGLNDISISGSYLRNAQLYCKEDYSSACTMSGSFTGCNARSNDKTCENYYKQSTTTSTTTADPTTAPPITASSTTAPPTTPRPTQRPTTLSPTNRPTLRPTTGTPTLRPTNRPTQRPTQRPTLRPTQRPTQKLTLRPTTSSPTTRAPITKTPTTVPPTIKQRTREPSARPTVSTTNTPTLRPTMRPTPNTRSTTPSPVTGSPTTRLPTMRPTLRPISEYYDEERDPPAITTSTPITSAPVTAAPVTPRPTRAMLTNRPTRETQRMSLLTTTPMGAGFGYNSNPDLQNLDEGEPESGSSGGLNSLYYVITILLTSICYISCALFCWVHYNHKYTKRIIALRRNSQNHSENHDLSPIVGHHRIVSLKSYHSKSEMLPLDGDNLENVSGMNRNRLRTSSLASFATAPTSMMSMGDMGAPTTSHDTLSSGSSSISTTTDALSSATHSTNDCDDFKEINYETNGHNFIEEEEDDDDDEEDNLLETGTQATSIDNESVVRDSAPSSKYGESKSRMSVDGPKETHNLQLSNLSDLKINGIDGKTKCRINIDGNNNYVYTWQDNNGMDVEDTTSEDDENLNDELEHKSIKSNHETNLCSNTRGLPVPNMDYDYDEDEDEDEDEEDVNENENFPDTEVIYDLSARQTQFDSSAPQAYKYQQNPLMSNNNSNDSIHVGQSISISGIGYNGNNATLLQRIWSSYPSQSETK